LSWSLRDYRQQNQGEPQPETVPPPDIHDDAPLPTYAAGLEQYTEDGLLDDEYQLPYWQRLEIQRQGYPTEQQLARISAWMRRGVQEE
jgi:hypothetical protein